MNSTPDSQIAANLSQSLATAATGLRQFKQNLIASKLEHALSAYIQLKTLLIQQRLWACNSGRNELDPLFAQIAAEADAIHAILTPYAELMLALKNIHCLTPSGTPSDQTAPDSEETVETLEHAILRVLLTYGPCTVATLTSKLRKSAKQVRAAVENLRKSGRVQLRRSSFHLTPQAVSEAIKTVMMDRV